MATTRLRRVFRYPDGSSDDENDRDELDEEEQENVIKRLQLLNEQRNCEYSVSTIPGISGVVCTEIHA
ncbi:uncharacterized protein ACLA_045270 [Aspergillus clavatus NRRL 1]|uniref:Uncharacterized protein n=1 Tax=Aspergillus clavatus (strain ATCC 1007 / CBS 513.65 / DSM 816 / NCTC 3887 / NRRL 1 / QM 1276 / 107) TaxID=344612 RepID=A1CGQ7_ASPCL|nr:uncharacterized protein ACLA_045270 [Aspergillus clavatus NRRL 1]EAW10062.1 hypothetical protein ACLA_045270 [Aspergillus clavatus NRRL 1]